MKNDESKQLFSKHPTTQQIDEVRYGRNHTCLAGRFPAFSSVGGYTIRYVTADGADLCAACVNGENGSGVGSDSSVYDDGTSDPQWTVVRAYAFFEGATVQCDHCGDDIEASYGDPDKDGDED